MRETKRVRRNIAIMHRQWSEIRAGKFITCPCGHRLDALHAWRCFFCGVRFCKDCGADHFGEQMHQEPSAAAARAEAGYGAIGPRGGPRVAPREGSGIPAAAMA